MFLSHSSHDADTVDELARRIRDVQPHLHIFLDRWVLIPGGLWQPEIARALETADSCAVCLGREPPGGWFDQEIQVALNRQVADPSFRVFGVLLPASDPHDVGSFLRLRTWVDFRDGLDAERALEEMLCGIEGRPPGPPRKRTPMQAPDSEWAATQLQKIKCVEAHLHPDLVIEYQRKVMDRLVEIPSHHDQDG